MLTVDIMKHLSKVVSPPPEDLKWNSPYSVYLDLNLADIIACHGTKAKIHFMITQESIRTDHIFTCHSVLHKSETSLLIKLKQLCLSL